MKRDPAFGVIALACSLRHSAAPRSAAQIPDYVAKAISERQDAKNDERREARDRSVLRETR